MTWAATTKKMLAEQCILSFLLEKNTVLLRTVLSIKSRPSEWKFKDAITVFVTYCEGCIDLLFFISPKWSSELLSPP